MWKRSLIALAFAVGFVSAAPSGTTTAAVSTPTTIRTDQDPVYHFYLQNVGTSFSFFLQWSRPKNMLSRWQARARPRNFCGRVPHQQYHSTLKLVLPVVLQRQLHRNNIIQARLLQLKCRYKHMGYER